MRPTQRGKRPVIGSVLLYNSSLYLSLIPNYYYITLHWIYTNLLHIG